MNLNGCEIDGVPAPSDWELCPDGLDRERAISRLRACIRQNLAVIAERDGYRAVAEQRAAEVERLREENGQIAELCDGTLSTNAELAAKAERLRVVLEEHETTIRALSRSDVERFKENNALNAKLGRLRGALDCANEWNSIWRVMNAYASGDMMELSGGCDPHAILGHVYQGMAIIYQRRNAALKEER